ncbi:MAG: site-specific integrase [Ruminococcus sp.]|nr:site-specific integrase [Ruminococcus sp.]
MNIYQRRDGRFEGRISRGKRSNGTRRFQYFFGKTEEDVREKMAKERRKKSNFPLTVTQLFSEWHSSIKHKVKESTAANYYLKANKHILPAFGDKSAESIEDTEIYAFIESKQKVGLSNRYISDMLIVMKSMFKYAVRTYHIYNPMEYIKMPRAKNPEITLLDENEQAKLKEYIGHNQNKATLGVALSMTTGIRIGELCALQWKDINLEKRILTVSKTMQRVQIQGSDKKTKLVITEPKSESSRRKIPIPKGMIAFLEKFKGKDSDYILSGKEKPIEPRSMQYRFQKILKNVKLPSVHFHALRHIFVSTCVKLGFDVKALSELLGHSTVELTLNRYVHSSFEQKIKYMERLAVNF